MTEQASGAAEKDQKPLLDDGGGIELFRDEPYRDQPDDDDDIESMLDDDDVYMESQETSPRKGGNCMIRFSACIFMASVVILLPITVYQAVMDQTNALPMCSQDHTNHAGWTTWKELQGGKADEEQCGYLDDTPQCSCSKPIVAQKRVDHKWESRFDRIKKVAYDSTKLPWAIDFVFLGDDIVERWTGYQRGERRSNLDGNLALYQQFFNSTQSPIKGLALGMDGDACPQLIHRLENGELPESLNPPLIWLLVGANDIVNKDCSVNATFAGLVHVVETVRQIKPKAHIVLHSVMPRTRHKLVEWPVWQSMTQLNELMECYASGDSAVSFFNATDLFTTIWGGKINTTLLEDGVHPSAIGSVKWGEEIVKLSLDLLGRDQLGPEAFDQITLDLDKVNESPKHAKKQAECRKGITSGLDWSAWKESIGLRPKQDLCWKDICRCRNPIKPYPKQDMAELWNAASERNKQLALDSMQSGRAADMVLFGDSLVEHFLGTDQSRHSEHWNKNLDLYNEVFRNSELFSGLAMGIGGDMTPQMLQRIANGELPAELKPNVVWVLVGTNDIDMGFCSANTTLAGIIQIAEDIHDLYKDAKVVLHSVLPRGHEDLLQDKGWQITSELNDGLECYAGSQNHVSFFNGTDYFLDDSKRMVNLTLMSDELHPNGPGSKCWIQGMIQTTLELLGRNMPDADGECLSGIAGSATGEPSKVKAQCDAEVLGDGAINTWEEWISRQSELDKETACWHSFCTCTDPMVPARGTNPYWQGEFEQNVETANHFAQAENGPIDMVMYGDSIINHWQKLVNANNQSIHEEKFENSSVKSIALGVRGDRSSGLLYRLSNGELPDGLSPKFIWIMIGTNSLSDGCNHFLIAGGILKVVREIREKRPESNIILNAILPRGRKALPNDGGWREIKQVNRLLECYANSHEMMWFANDTDIFVTDNDTRVNSELMADYLHPTAEGYDLWGDRIIDFVTSLPLEQP